MDRKILVAGNRPAITFLAHRNGVDQSSVSSTATIAFTHTDFNTGGYFSTASGDFTPPAGTYEIGLTIRLATGAAANAGHGAIIAKDGSDALNAYMQSAVASIFFSIPVQGLVKTTGTSVFTARISFGGTATGTIEGDSSQTYFWAKEVTR